MKQWQLQEAKAKLSKLVKAAAAQHPQTITVRGEPQVVVLSKKKYDELTGGKASFVDFIEQSPLKGVKLSITRDKSLPRDVEL